MMKNHSFDMVKKCGKNPPTESSYVFHCLKNKKSEDQCEESEKKAGFLPTMLQSLDQYIRMGDSVLSTPDYTDIYQNMISKKENDIRHYRNLNHFVLLKLESKMRVLLDFAKSNVDQITKETRHLKTSLQALRESNSHIQDLVCRSRKKQNLSRISRSEDYHPRNGARLAWKELEVLRSKIGVERRRTFGTLKTVVELKDRLRKTELRRKMLKTCYREEKRRLEGVLEEMAGQNVSGKETGKMTRKTETKEKIVPIEELEDEILKFCV